MKINTDNNFFKVFLSNFLLIISGVVTGFLLPKFLGVTDYGYYKIFNLYTTYVVFFDLGISNGLYLELGGISKENIPRERLRFYFSLLTILQITFLFIITVVALLVNDGEYKFILIMLGVYLIANNISNYYEKVSIAIGDFDALSKRNVLKSTLSIATVAVLWIGISLDWPYKYYKIYTFSFVAMYILLALQYVYRFRDISFGKKVTLSNEKASLISISKNGLLLLLADMIASLILNIDRQFVSITFDVETYSIYSFAYSMLKIIVLAVSAISSLIYPLLRKMTWEEMKKSYKCLLSVIQVIAVACQLAYYPLSIIVVMFLPSYERSLTIFRILFPSITINVIVSLLIVNYYKALKKQNLYFIITVLVLVLSIMLNLLALVISHEPSGFSIASVITMVVWYVLSANHIEKIYNITTKSQSLYLSISIIIFYIISFNISNFYIGFALNLFLFTLSSFLFYGKRLLLSKTNNKS